LHIVDVFQRMFDCPLSFSVLLLTQYFLPLAAQLYPPWISQRGSISCACLVNSRYVVGATDRGEMFLLNVHDRQTPELIGFIQTGFAPAYPASISPWEGDTVALGLSNGGILRMKIVHPMSS
jgi:hypothetical protein